MDVLLYGLGRMTEKIEKIIRKEHRIIGYSDSYSKINLYKGKKFFLPEEIKNVGYDFIIITTGERKTAWQIQQELVNNYDIEKEKIIPFAVYAKSEIVENTMTELKDIDGIILGNSHAFYSILPKYLNGKFISLACPSQDIYHNYMAFQRYVSKECSGGGNNLKYIIFDLYDYNFFNSDVSLTKGLLSYMCWGGVIDKRNFDLNTHYAMEFEKELFNAHYMLAKLTEKDKQSMDMMFGTYENPILADMNYQMQNRWNYIKPDEPLQSDKFVADVVTKKFKSTILENIKILDKFIRAVKKINSNCKIIFTLIPRYITMEKVMSVTMKEWKQDFETILNDFQEKYEDVHFFNYKNRIEISGNNHFYGDICHMNALGGRCFTTMLSGDISKFD